VAELERVIAGLETFEPSDIDIDNTQFFYKLLEGFDDFQAHERQQAIPAMFALFERFPDAELGNPGPLVHTLERMGGYEGELRRSLHRRASFYTVWMVNRIINGEKEARVRRDWLAVLENVASDERNLADVREEASRLVAHQHGIEHDA
jgi:hypothetical protein